jgi:hypothetical protein
MITFKEYLLGEMTLVDPAVSAKMLYDYLDDIEPLIIHGGGVTHIGDIEEYQVYHTKYNNYEVYALRKDDEVACVFKCMFRTFPIIDKVLYVFIMVTKPSFQGKALSAKMIHFFNTREVWHVLIDDLLSPSNKNNLEKIAKDENSSACWYNVKTGEIEPFKNTEGKYTFNFAHPETHWQILFQKRHKGDNEDIFKTEEVYSRFWKREHIAECRMINGYEHLGLGTD